MTDPTWFLGPLGDMRPLVVPEPGIEINEVRLGGVRQGLSGARSMDITGYRAEYVLSFKHLDRDEFAWLEALHARLVPGPFYLISPLKQNRLTTQATALRLTNYSNSGVTTTSPHSVSRDWPTDIAVPGRSLELYGWQGANTTVFFDQSKPVPLLPGETLTASVRMRANAVYTGAKLRISWYTEDGVFISNSDLTVSISTTWSIHWFTYHEAPRNAASAVMSVILGSAGSARIFIAAPMMETGVTWPSPWELGGGAPLVLLDQMPTASNRFPLRDASITLLEA